jgi:hypothetical protein
MCNSDLCKRVSVLVLIVAFLGWNVIFEIHNNSTQPLLKGQDPEIIDPQLCSITLITASVEWTFADTSPARLHSFNCPDGLYQLD